ncbi:hypothetical protein EXIGLDRAFT_772857 [Exidia glandulosa HHB12029]|nr:hypothetical protein EXIGLDRAFT_772857 [Exidia glandulosa HHB12029]
MVARYRNPPHPHAYGFRGPPSPERLRTLARAERDRYKPASFTKGSKNAARPASRPTPPQKSSEDYKEKEWDVFVDLNRARSEPAAAIAHDDRSLVQFYHLLPPKSEPDPALLLTRFLESTSDESLSRYNAHAIINLYHSAQHWESSRSQKTMTSRHYSLLIALFGALSVITSAYESTLLPRRATPSALLVQMIPQAYSDHWKFIKLVAKDKEEAGFSTGLIDRYWLMRQESAAAVAIPEEERIYRRREFNAHLKRAMAYHRRLHVQEPLFHTDICSTLVSHGAEVHADHVLDQMGRILLERPGLDPLLRKVLWQLALTRSDISSEARSRFADVVNAHLTDAAAQDKPSSPRPPPRSVTMKSGEIIVDVAPPTLDDVYVALFRVVTSSFDMSTFEWPDIAQWARTEVTALLSQTHSSSHADLFWQHIILLATASPSALEVQATQSPDIQLGDDVYRRRWIFVCSLLAILRVCEAQAYSADANTRRVLSSFWNMWLTAHRASPHSCPAPVERAILLGFIRTAGLAGDETLLDEIIGALPTLQHLLLKYEDYVRTGPFGDSGRAGAALELGAAYVQIHARAGSLDWAGVCCAVHRAKTVTTEDGLNNYANQLMRHLLRLRRSSAAAELYHVLVENVIKFADQTRVEMCQVFALELSTFPLAMQLHDERVMPRTKMCAVLVALTRGVFRQRFARINSTVARNLVASIDHHEYTPAPRTREHAHFRWTLVTGVASGAHDAVLDLLAKRLAKSSDPSYEFLSRFIVGIAGQLLKQRLFRAAARLLDLMPARHPARARLITLTIVRLSRGTAYHVGRKVWLKHRSVWVNDRHRLSRAAVLYKFARFNARDPHPTATMTLRRQRLEPRRPDVAYRTAMQLLVRAGRIRAANRLHTAIQTAGHVHEKTASVLGNILLYSRLRPRRQRRLLRQVRAVFAKLDELCASPNFRPDRVTLNIVLKAVIHWDLAIDVSKLRYLFNQLIASGYPGAPLPIYLGRAETAFDMGKIQRVMQDVPRGPIHFARHVRPLYRQFMSAFRARGDWESTRILSRQVAALRDRVAERERVRLIKTSIGRSRARYAREHARLVSSAG